MQIGIPRESLAGETRVAATPATVEQLKKLGFEVAIESGAGTLASFSDAAFEAVGASVVPSVWQADLIFKVNAPTENEIKEIKDGATLVSFIWPAQNPELVEKLSQRNINVMAMDMVPRISRAQSLDALSSMANIGGYRAVVEAAHEFGRFFTGQITAAGKVPPAKVLVIGAGVAGLAAIGTAGSLGAVVRAFDTRLEVAEQIESMGGQFLKLDFGGEDGSSSDGYAKVMSEEFIKAEMALFAEQAKEVDIIVTTALIPGKPAPRLITREMVDSMKSGSVIVDMAAATGGNCEYTVPGELFVTKNGVKVIGYTDLPGRLPAQSSQLYGTNLVNLMKLMCKEKDGNAVIDFDDVVMRNMTVVKAGEVTFPPPPISVSAAPAKAAPKVELKKAAPKEPSKLKYILGALGLIGFGAVASVAPPEFLSHFTVFLLSCVVGYYVVWNVTHALHTPLMSVTNAISGIIVVGALLQIGSGSTLVTVLAFIAVLIASINIFGGFTVTQRMLKMFRKD
ncbi:Re/Si-specific NAD(P)(+) transhydrogenase subunit alpha [Shewanella litorisediminis]|uniref:NAD(P) transhydrogenase subunit alpha n=1 Tax=Shewanella litorisediminis TaxID=1173586 RepID=A0ABX7G1B8_9GAMM|nr:Re/Si-specific NAD(P)(+) transhydrogenase subunit alpha [Shewanella litorisediminis]MCL2919030.1 Re/Si-specific NAD(P)(+) transhydrogenase subunit alpha [Shewanella litorisediminis]QRH01094.1 Re/Si-specific NAD(P)(+) transhydrogenase subunit alpha [Shewanella litorisediminis]